MSKAYEGLFGTIGRLAAEGGAAFPAVTPLDLREIIATDIPPAVGLDFWRTMVGHQEVYSAETWRLIFHALQDRYRPFEPWSNGQ